MVVERLLDGVELAVRREPSMVVISAPSTWTPRSVHDLTDAPSTSTVHAPHDDVSQPTFVPGQPQPVAEDVDEQLARLELQLVPRPVHGQRNASHLATSLRRSEPRRQTTTSARRRAKRVATLRACRRSARSTRTRLDRWVAACGPRSTRPTPRRATSTGSARRETIWLLASGGRGDVGAAIGIGGWHSPEGVARARCASRRRPRARRRLRAARGALGVGAAWATRS